MKPFKTIDEQINILKDRGLVIDLKMQMKYFLKKGIIILLMDIRIYF